MEVVDCLVVEDVGRLINPQIVHGQTIGALVQGLGGVFLDHVICAERTDAECFARGLPGPDRDRLSPGPRRDAGDAALAEQSARGQGGSEGGWRGDRRDHRQCGRSHSRHGTSNRRNCRFRRRGYGN